MSTTSMAIFSSLLYASYSVYACNASDLDQDTTWKQNRKFTGRCR